ncbi:hypothetical protein [Pseudomonas sp. KCJK8993]
MIASGDTPQQRIPLGQLDAQLMLSPASPDVGVFKHGDTLGSAFLILL